MRHPMKYLFYILLFSITACTIKENGKASKAAHPLTIHDFKIQDPDIATERQKILSYFERHKEESVFDTADRTYADWWGLWSASINSVSAGYLFNDKQVHAVLFYVAQQDTAVIDVRLKTEQGWTQIFADTTDPGRQIVIKDWNQDGTKDLSLQYMPNMMSAEVSYDLYLMDKSGTRMQPVAGFWELRSPQRDTISRIITTRNEYRSTEYFGIYDFTGAKVREIQAVHIHHHWSNDKDDTVTISYSDKNGVEKEIITREGDIDRYLPESIKRRLKEEDKE